MGARAAWRISSSRRSPSSRRTRKGKRKSSHECSTIAHFPGGGMYARAPVVQQVTLIYPSRPSSRSTFHNLLFLVTYFLIFLRFFCTLVVHRHYSRTDRLSLC